MAPGFFRAAYLVNISIEFGVLLAPTYLIKSLLCNEKAALHAEMYL